MKSPVFTLFFTLPIMGFTPNEEISKALVQRIFKDSFEPAGNFFNYSFQSVYVYFEGNPEKHSNGRFKMQRIQDVFFPLSKTSDPINSSINSSIIHNSFLLNTSNSIRNINNQSLHKYPPLKSIFSPNALKYHQSHNHLDSQDEGEIVLTFKTGNHGNENLS